MFEVDRTTNIMFERSKHNNYVAGFAFNHEELKPSLLLGYDTDNIKGNLLLDKGYNLNDEINNRISRELVNKYDYNALE